mmetsp:Transcript_12544/g.17140  ORF Transcript_12544/g.17140 Transcript_12544/m.17140 type:complete len:185 (-) Transcript_12544:2106-2660(-)
MDQTSLKDNLNCIRSHLNNVIEAKRSNQISTNTFKSQVLDGTLLLVDIKASNRVHYEKLQEVKEETQDSKSQLAQAHLQLQNLQYQKSYYLKEIRSCNEFQSSFSDEQIDMIPTEEFLSQGTSCGENIKELDPHTLMLRRLTAEQIQRKKLCQTLEELKSREKVILPSTRDFLSSALTRDMRKP